MTTVADLLHSGAHRGLVSLSGRDLGHSQDSPEVRDVAAIGDLADVAAPGAGALLVVLPSALRAAEPYELDVAVRHCIERDHAAVVLVGLHQLPVTSARLAARGGLAVLSVPAETNVAELILWLNRMVRGGAADTVARAEAALAVLARYADADTDPDADPAAGSADELVADLTAALGQALELRTPATDRAWVPPAPGSPGAVLIGDRVVGELVCPPGDHAARLVLPAAVAAIGTRKRRELERAFAPSQTRAELLAQIVMAESTQLTALDEQARRVDFPVDLNHVAAALRFRPDGDLSAEASLAAQRRLVDHAEMLCLERFLPQETWWHVARTGGGLLIVASDDLDGPSLTRVARAGLEELLADLRREDAEVYVGLGSDQRGLGGLRQSAAEARSALDLAQQTGREGAVTTLDVTGVRRVLADLWSSPLSRRIVRDMLAPLDALGPERSARAIETLSAYLDHQSSPKHAAAALHLHPNAVSYRMQRIEATLGVDLTDPDVRFGLHLACRMRGTELLAPGGAG
ncbi:helix-turn-helix domain-containing protein [Nocardioides sp. YIM 152588]|uniref:helix-turn-helix domain-containing protein n=1 Tax=Nocardioides sp. YIM 152588 TaxID=3158259 RepID=UPI0032E3A7CE